MCCLQRVWGAEAEWSLICQKALILLVQNVPASICLQALRADYVGRIDTIVPLAADPGAPIIIQGVHALIEKTDRVLCQSLSCSILVLAGFLHECLSDLFALSCDD